MAPARVTTPSFQILLSTLLPGPQRSGEGTRASAQRAHTELGGGQGLRWGKKRSRGELGSPAAFRGAHRKLRLSQGWSRRLRSREKDRGTGALQQRQHPFLLTHLTLSGEAQSTRIILCANATQALAEPLSPGHLGAPRRRTGCGSHRLSPRAGSSRCAPLLPGWPGCGERSWGCLVLLGPGALGGARLAPR